MAAGHSAGPSVHRHPTLTLHLPPALRFRGDRRRGLLNGIRQSIRPVGLVGGGLARLTLGGSATLAHIITRPRHRRVIAARTIDEMVEEVAFRSADGVILRGWYLAHVAPRDLLIICPGYAMNRHELLDLARTLHANGYAILLFDFRAHDLSEGTRSMIGYREADDVVAAVGYVRARPELAALPLGVAGGAAAALLAAAREQRIGAVVADSSFTALGATALGSLRTLVHGAAVPLGPLILRFGEFLTRAPDDESPDRRDRHPHAAPGADHPRHRRHLHHEAASEPKEIWARSGRGHASLWSCCAAEYAERLDHFFTDAVATARASVAA